MIKNNKKIFIGFVLLSIFSVIVGIIFLVLGLRNYVKTLIVTRNYETVYGRFIDFTRESYDNIENRAYYKLKYEYEVDGKFYTIFSDYSTTNIPKKDSLRKIKYDKNDPSKAILIGASSNGIMLIMGPLFIFIPLVIFNPIIKHKKINQKYEFITIGIVFLIFSIFFFNINIYGLKFSLKDNFKDLLPSLIFFIGSIILIIKGIFDKGNKKSEVNS